MTTKIETKIGKRLRYYRQQKKLSQEELAEISGVHRTYIGAVERGERNITIKALDRMVTSMGYTLSEFFNTIEFK